MKQQPLDRVLLFQVKNAWEQVNYQLFNGLLRLPSFQLLESSSLLGSWNARHRIISLQRQLICTAPWLEVIETLKHEMAHQYVSEVLKVTSESAHGPTFQKVCIERRIISKASGTQTEDPEVTKLLVKINKLLALAESDNINEAEQAAQRAHGLLIKHHLKLGQVSGQHTGALTHMGFRQLGTPKSRHFQYEYSIANLLNEHFFVSTIWVNAYSVSQNKEGRVLEICGRVEDLEIASYVYDFIHHHVDFYWRQYRVEKKVKGLKKRLSFSLGLVQGFKKKLSENERKVAVNDREMIYIGQAHANELLAGRYPKITTRHSSSWSPTMDYHSGFKEGQALRLRKGVANTDVQRHKQRQLTYQD